MAQFDQILWIAELPVLITTALESSPMSDQCQTSDSFGKE